METNKKWTENTSSYLVYHARKHYIELAINEESY